MIHSKTVAASKKGNKMTKMYERGNILWVNYYVDGKRIQKSTKLPNTPENIKIVTSKIIPQIDLKIATGEIYKRKPKTFAYYGDIYLKHKSKDKNFSRMKQFYNKIENHFGSKNIDAITRLDIKQYLLNLEIKSKNPYKTVINSVFELAVDDGIISTNPSLNIRLTPQKKKEVEYFTKEEVRSILNAVSDDLMRVYLLIAFNTGMRSGEVLGLQLGDFEKNHISIKRTRTLGVVGSGKNNLSLRKVPYPSYILDEVKKVQGNNIFIFGNLDDASKLNYQWYKLLHIAKVKRLRLYCTRHTFATTMLQDEVVSINELAGLLGHSSVKTTLDTYSAVIKPNTIEIGRDFDIYSDVSVTVKNTKASKAQ